MVVVVVVEGEEADEGAGTGTMAMPAEEVVVVVVAELEVVVEEVVGLGLGEAVTVGVMMTVDVELMAPEGPFGPSQLSVCFILRLYNWNETHNQCPHTNSPECSNLRPDCLDSSYIPHHKSSPSPSTFAPARNIPRRRGQCP